MPHADITSPCISICVMDEARGYCSGCQRTLEEIARWVDLSPAQKREVLAHVEARRAAVGISH
jgi:predicted Fe-S protein YdhL (DUF1289 family)